MENTFEDGYEKGYNEGVKFGRQLNFPPIQLCPKCKGQGIVSKPPNIAGDVDSWNHTEITFKCNLCDGKMFIRQVVN